MSDDTKELLAMVACYLIWTAGLIGMACAF